MNFEKLRIQNIEETRKKLEQCYEDERLIKLLRFAEKFEQLVEQSRPELTECASEISEQLSVLKSRLDTTICKLTKEIMPNTAAVCGCVLGAKLLKAAGSMKNLASMPSSKIQLLGAEKALFRHLKEGTKAPKHGLIVMHPSVTKAKNKGKAARHLANEIAKAARIDYFRQR